MLILQLKQLKFKKQTVYVKNHAHHVVFKNNLQMKFISYAKILNYNYPWYETVFARVVIVVLESLGGNKN